MEKFKCIQTFELPRYDQEENITDEFGEVSKDSLWESDGINLGDADIRMYSENENNHFSYIDITYETLNKYFSRIR